MLQTTRPLSFRLFAVWMIYSLIFIATSHAHAETAIFTLDNVILAGGGQITGTFSWTYDAGDFENGVGEFTELEIPLLPGGTLPPLEEPGMILTIENNQIEISLDGNFHDYGLDIKIKFEQPLSLTQASLIDLNESFYECCGNGFQDQPFVSGSILHTEIAFGDASGDGVLNNADIAAFVLALTNAVAYQAMFPNVDPDVVLDMNGDGAFNNGDIAAFVAALTGGGTK